MEHTIAELQYRQALPLSMKVAFTKTRIRQWIAQYGFDGVYLSYSGGKDSTVLSHIIDELYPENEIPRVFIDTGLEYPEIRAFAMKEPRCVIVKPTMNFKKVIEKYGYPLFSKENALFLRQLQHPTEKNKATQRLRLEGIKKDGTTSKRGQLPQYLHFMINAPFNVSEKCCDKMKKEPAHKYAHKTGRAAMTAELAGESRVREQKWLQHGCNMFDLKEPKSTPMATWTEQDVLLYIKTNNIEICSVYGEIVTDNESEGQIDGQMSLTDFTKQCGEFDVGNPKLKTTGCDRTGCMFCGFGCHLQKKSRFEELHKTHPKVYDYLMRSKEQGGLNYKEVLDWINENGNLHIRY